MSPAANIRCQQGGSLFAKGLWYQIKAKRQYIAAMAAITDISVRLDEGSDEGVGDDRMAGTPF